jgi:hypothetical protein
MKITQTIMNHDEGRGILVILDDEALTLELVGTLKNDFKEQCTSLAAMEKAYKKRIAPYLKRHNCHDTDRSQDTARRKRVKVRGVFVSRRERHDRERASSITGEVIRDRAPPARRLRRFASVGSGR